MSELLYCTGCHAAIATGLEVVVDGENYHTGCKAKAEDSALDRAKAEVNEMIGGRTLEERAMGEHTDPTKTELWTPPERLSANVGKMAWAMFLKIWEDATKSKFATVFVDGKHDGLVEWAAEEYRNCIAVAKGLEDINTDPSKKPDEPVRETG